MKIRTHPEDFAVEEVLRDDVVRQITPEPGARRHAVYRLTKTSLTTDEATRRLARALGIAPGDLSAAGLKDKHARTTQHISVKPGGTSTPATLSGEGWDAQLAGWSPETAVAAWIRRNRFRLVVRGLTDEACARMDRAAAFLQTGAGRLLVVNYFGDQRFGSARHGEGFAGARLIRADFEGALRLLIGTPARKDTGARRVYTRLLAAEWGRWNDVLPRFPRRPERRAVEVLAANGDFRAAFAALPSMLQQMAVEAFQSHLWNATARTLSLGLSHTRGAIIAPDVHGEMIFPFPAVVAGGWRTLELPMLAASTTLTDPWKSAVSQTLAEEGITQQDLTVPGLRRPSFGEAWRPFIVLADRFEMSAPEPGAHARHIGRMQRTVSFELPRGAYATVVLRALSGIPSGPTAT